MAKKKRGPNKSAAIRDYYEANPNAKPKEVQAALADQGVKTTTAFVSTIRTNMKKGKGTKRPGRPPAKSGRGPGRPAGKTSRKTVAKRKTAASADPSGVSIDSLIKVKKVVEEMGSVDDARAALNALEKLLR